MLYPSKLFSPQKSEKYYSYVKHDHLDGVAQRYFEHFGCKKIIFKTVRKQIFKIKFKNNNQEFYMIYMLKL